MDIGDILSNLSDSDMENLRAAAQELFGGERQGGEKNGGERDEKGENGGARNGQGSGMPDISELLGNAEVMSRLAGLMGAMNKKDEKSELINSLKPLLSEKRRKRADEAARIMKLIDILPMLKGDG